MLRFALEKPNIRIFYGFEVTKARKVNGTFLVENGEQCHSCDKLIIACGGLAGTKLGGSMSGYKLLGRFGHRSTKLRPALVQVKTDWAGVAGLKGVRANCHVRIIHNGEVFAQSTGELQFTEIGLSGPVMFEVSRDVCQSPGSWVCRLDFLPHITDEMLDAELKRRRTTALSVDELLTGILHNRLGRVLTKSAGIKGSGLVKELTDVEQRELCRAVKTFEVVLTEPMGMDSAQVTAGGVLTSQFDPDTMESRLVHGLYACGEVLDIDGDCGGYNLQWAWSSGHCAGLNAGKEA
jgi:predicted Rossmann fold flavoprotein